jgi:translocation and assembly module TamB
MLPCRHDRKPERLPGSLQPLPGTRHIDPTPTTAARLAIASKSAKGGKIAPAFNAALDLTIAAPNAIRVHGRGLDAQLGGNLSRRRASSRRKRSDRLKPALKQ